jgi:hypothetical protein
MSDAAGASTGEVLAPVDDGDYLDRVGTDGVHQPVWALDEFAK